MLLNRIFTRGSWYIGRVLKISVSQIHALEDPKALAYSSKKRIAGLFLAAAMIRIFNSNVKQE